MFQEKDLRELVIPENYVNSLFSDRGEENYIL